MIRIMITAFACVAMQSGISQNVGIGVTNPTHRLDVGSQMRLRAFTSGQTLLPGIWFSNASNSINRAFLGMEQGDSTLGVFSQNYNRWAVQIEVMREPRLGVGMRDNIDGGTVRSEIHVIHTNFGSAADGVRIQNEGPNGHYWNLYTTNSTGTLAFYKNGTQRATIDPASGAFTALSDSRLKQNALPVAANIMDKIMQLQPMRYQFINMINSDGEGISNDQRFHFGFMAQDVQMIFPELVFEGADNPAQNFLTMNYAGFGVLAIKAIQEQQKEIVSLRGELEALKGLVEKLSSQ